ncbi:MAG: Asp-tRNA(Asn)/Glu-tRNA(Gln) amidotransferase subunit GatB [Candidatus Altiarchaeales archaeon]|nr:Asp-tRNA(Asn)/Glu-tRNA(Gln) amidotransferase subunit GatB [Candidatus Altiarchaeales archaeon]MBD3415847.1 Asp-tRNA(Asn)/Glu-tRNA(Gln) amidotransferase subunit GatB [Candidatus Altiarchaeales archaeon]
MCFIGIEYSHVLLSVLSSSFFRPCSFIISTVADEDLDVMIGMEIHVPLKTQRKLFCDCPINYWDVEEPNLNTCPVCTGMPGSKPYPLNEGAVEAAVMIAELLECEIARDNVFVKRKHYDYPDLPSGYQRTSEPIGVEGRVGDVGIWEVHLEEDPGRYDLKTGNVDYNRSGVPLIEIVSAPDMKGPAEVRDFMRELVNILRYSERVVDVGGVMRADVNISIKGGAKVEIKNINSVAGAFKALQYEIIRQKNMMARGAVVRQETRGFDEKTQVTRPQRVKETAADYRYIPDPDIPPQHFTEEYTASIELPETPQLRRKRLIEEYGVREDYAQTMVRDKDIADLFEEVKGGVGVELASMWICREVLRQLNYRSIDLRESKLSAAIMVELLKLLESDEITENVGKKLLERVIDSGESPSKIVEEERLGRVSGEGELSSVVDEVIGENVKAVADYKSGEKTALNFLMGAVMKKMRGRADSKVVLELLGRRLDDDSGR